MSAIKYQGSLCPTEKTFHYRSFISTQIARLNLWREIGSSEQLMTGLATRDRKMMITFINHLHHHNFGVNIFGESLFVKNR